jgi:hypothetical protein
MRISAEYGSSRIRAGRADEIAMDASDMILGREAYNPAYQNHRGP